MTMVEQATVFSTEGKLLEQHPEKRAVLTIFGPL